MKDIPGFNKSKKLRRAWQDGSDTSRTVYVMSSQMFLKRTPSHSKKEADVEYPLHPWIETVKRTTSYFPNPDRPEFLEPSRGHLVSISECDPPHIRTGDLVWITFFAEFIIGLNNWSTAFTPFEIIRVGAVTPDLVGDGLSGAAEEDVPRPRLGAGFKLMSSTHILHLSCRMC